MEKVDITEYRQAIDNIDAALVHILAECFRCTYEIGVLKAKHNVPPVDKGREDLQYARLKNLAEDAKFDRNFIENLTKFIINEVIERHNQSASEHQARQARGPQRYT